MLYYRRKILLYILEQTKNLKLNKLNFQKILFLFCQRQERSIYDFIPYKFGCFSYEANNDLYVLSSHYKVISNTDKEWILSTDMRYKDDVKFEDRKILDDIFRNIDIYNTDELLVKTYSEYPYFAVNSQVLSKVQEVTRSIVEIKKNNINQEQNICLYSIGYEGISIDSYLNK